MDQQYLQQFIEQNAMEILAIIQMIYQMNEEDLNAFMEQLTAFAERQQEGGASGEQMAEEQMANNEMYGGY